MDEPNTSMFGMHCIYLNCNRVIVHEKLILYSSIYFADIATCHHKSSQGMVNVSTTYLKQSKVLSQDLKGRGHCSGKLKYINFSCNAQNNFFHSGRERYV